MLAPGAWAQHGQQEGAMPARAEQLYALANRARTQAGLTALKWDPELAEAARKHCLLMAEKGPIAHRYGGEASVSDRAAEAGARFSLIEENVAVGSSPEQIQDEWMHSPPHRANLMNPKIDRIGTAVVEARGVLYAVADFSEAVQRLSRTQIEAQVGDLIRVSGVAIQHDPTEAREACTTDEGIPHTHHGRQPLFLMRWQASALDRLPKALADRLATGQYHSASVGSCSPEGQNAFSAYRVAVLLY